MLEFCQCSCRLICTSSIWWSFTCFDSRFNPRCWIRRFFLLVVHVWQVRCFFFLLLFQLDVFQPQAELINHESCTGCEPFEEGVLWGLLFFIGIAVIAVDIFHGFWAKTTRMATGDDQNHSFKGIIFENCWLVQLFRAFFSELLLESCLWYPSAFFMWCCGMPKQICICSTCNNLVNFNSSV